MLPRFVTIVLASYMLLGACPMQMSVLHDELTKLADNSLPCHRQEEQQTSNLDHGSCPLCVFASENSTDDGAFAVKEYEVNTIAISTPANTLQTALIIQDEIGAANGAWRNPSPPGLAIHIATTVLRT